METNQKQETDIIVQFRQIATNHRNEVNERERKKKEKRRNLAKRLVDAAIDYMATKKQTRAKISKYERYKDGEMQGQKEWTYGINKKCEVVVSYRESQILDKKLNTVIELMRDIATEYNIQDIVNIYKDTGKLGFKKRIAVEMI